MLNKHLTAAIAFALFLSLSLWLLSPAWMTGAAAAPKPSSTDEPDFKGKVIVIRLAFSTEPLALEGAKVRKLGDRFFLMGKVVAVREGNDALQNKAVWHSLYEISQIIECDSVDTAKKTLKTLPRGLGIPGQTPYGGLPGMPEAESTPNKK